VCGLLVDAPRASIRSRFSQPPSGPSSTSLTTAHRTPVITRSLSVVPSPLAMRRWRCRPCSRRPFHDRADRHGRHMTSAGRQARHRPSSKTDRAKYPDITSRWEGLTENGRIPSFFANGLHHIAITAPAPSTGQGANWWANNGQNGRSTATPARPPDSSPPMPLQIKEPHRCPHRRPELHQLALLGHSSSL